MKKLLCCQLLSHLCLLTMVCVSANAQEQFSTLLAKIPSSANSIMAIDAGGLRSSALGKSQNWMSRNEALFATSPFYLPPEASHLIVASQMNPNRDFHQLWELAVMALSEPVTIRGIARAEGGSLDQIANHPAVLSPNDAYFVLFSENELAMMSPADRQAVTRWVENTPVSSQVSEFLKLSLKEIQGDCQIVLALDLSDAVVPDQVRKGLSEAEFLSKDVAQQAAWQAIIESLIGVQLEVSVTEKISGRIKVVFGKNADVFGKVGKTALLHVLDRHGVTFEKIESWSFTGRDAVIELQGEMSLADLRRIMSLLELPSSNFSHLADAAVPGDSQVVQKDTVVEASKKYYLSIKTLLTDLESEFRTNKDARRNFATTYMKRYASRIDNLPILNVDTELVDYAMTVAETLRSTSVIQGEANIDAGVRKSSVYQTNNSYYYNDYRSTSSLKSQISREEQSVAMKARFGNWKEIQDATAQMRVKMTQKYNTEF